MALSDSELIAMYRDRKAGKIVAYRLHTGEPSRKWQWMDGLPCHGVLQMAEQNKYEIEYAYSATQESPQLQPDPIQRGNEDLV